MKTLIACLGLQLVDWSYLWPLSFDQILKHELFQISTRFVSQQCWKYMQLDNSSLLVACTQSPPLVCLPNGAEHVIWQILGLLYQLQIVPSHIIGSIYWSGADECIMFLYLHQIWIPQLFFSFFCGHVAPIKKKLQQTPPHTFSSFCCMDSPG